MASIQRQLQALQGEMGKVMRLEADVQSLKQTVDSVVENQNKIIRALNGQ